MLANSTAKDIVIYNHVITRDHYSTEHNMTAEEAEHFEGILTAYKAAHPNVTVEVFFGHLHTLDTWTVGGVQYTIGGNAAGKGYVTAEQGNLLGSGILQVTDGQAAYRYEPMATRVYIRSDAMTAGSLTAVEGSSVPLQLYGDFHDAAVNSSKGTDHMGTRAGLSERYRHGHLCSRQHRQPPTDLDGHGPHKRNESFRHGGGKALGD